MQLPILANKPLTTTTSHGHKRILYGSHHQLCLKKRYTETAKKAILTKRHFRRQRSDCLACRRQQQPNKKARPEKNDIRMDSTPSILSLSLHHSVILSVFLTLSLLSLSTPSSSSLSLLSPPSLPTRFVTSVGLPPPSLSVSIFISQLPYHYVVVLGIGLHSEKRENGIPFWQVIYLATHMHSGRNLFKVDRWMFFMC